MKKKYIAPQSVAFNFAPNQMLASSTNSIGIHSGERADSEAFTNKNGGWNSSDWSESAED